MAKRLIAFEVGAWVIAFLCGAALLVIRTQADATQDAALGLDVRGIMYVQASSTSRSALEQTPMSSGGMNEVVSAKIMGHLEIKPISLTVPILDNFDPSSLRKGVGHIHGTALPGGLGNMALAGHRDTFFRPLRNIQKGMTMSVYTAGNRYDYVVDSTAIVDPEQVSVLAIHNTPELTLITCYPFDFIGSAPHRFIVRAHLQSLEPILH